MQITPLPQGFGARIDGFDIHQGREADDIARLQRAYRDHHLLVFPGDGRFGPERQIEIAGWFGPIVDENGDGWTVLDNAEASGSDVLLFHSDIEFLPVPLMGLTLYPQELPPYETSTTFISTELAWRSLPKALQAELHDCTAIHHYRTEEGFIDYNISHPVRMIDPTTGEPLLYVSEFHVVEIDGLAEGRSAQVLPQLFAALYAPDRKYEHFWREGDLLVWNNRTVQHARTEVAELARGKRVMRRVQLGETGYVEQVEKLRQQSALAG
jgi:taurine dioxygenase